jgi:hypothetical protein
MFQPLKDAFGIETPTAAVREHAIHHRCVQNLPASGYQFPVEIGLLVELTIIWSPQILQQSAAYVMGQKRHDLKIS